jgi:tRNA-2-methylthio-N6-dimethylallyladenosine synthase
MAAGMSRAPVAGRPASQEELPSRPASFRVETWGCQMNVLDGQRMAGQLESLGHSRAVEDEAPGVVLLNTCAVREKAESKVFSELGVLARRKQLDPDLIVGVTGCVAQVSGEEILERAPFVDFVVGTGQIERVGELVELARRERKRSLSLELPEEDPVYQFRQIARESPFQAYVTIIEGCDQFCTFCIVPFTRGRERSRRAAEVVAEVRHLVSRGFSEVTLLGQTVNAYRDPVEGLGLGRLLRLVARVEGLRRLRFLTSHPALVDEELVAAMAGEARVAPYLHLPAQSGSDRILRRMKRRYDGAGYRDTVARIRAAVPGISISSDFIVGFPGETEEDFRSTLEMVRDLEFGSLFAFRYSPRPGTASARWGKQAEVPQEVAEDRLARLLGLQTQIQGRLNRGLVGRELEVLLERRNRRGQWTGRTACNRIVHLEGEDGSFSPGTYVRVLVTRGQPNSLLGRRIRAPGESA